MYQRRVPIGGSGNDVELRRIVDSKLKKWLRWFDVIKDEVGELVVAKHIFHTIQTIIKTNPSLHQPSSFYHYLSNTYVSHSVVGLRRQIKYSAQSISMRRLLAEMVQSPNTLTRNYFVGLYKGTTSERYANSDFNKFAVSSASHIDPSLVDVDLNRLLDASRRLEDFADKRVAHRDEREPKKLPTYNEIDACIVLLDELYVKYFLLFHAMSMDSLSPTWQYDWTAIFRVPWIPPSVDDPWP